MTTSTWAQRQPTQVDQTMSLPTHALGPGNPAPSENQGSQSSIPVSRIISMYLSEGKLPVVEHTHPSEI